MASNLDPLNQLRPDSEYYNQDVVAIVRRLAMEDLRKNAKRPDHEARFPQELYQNRIGKVYLPNQI